MRVKAIWKGSPNFTPKNPGREITCVIIHATATENKESPLDWLCNKYSKVSAHYLIDKQGMVYNLVDEQNLAWHAGNLVCKGEAHITKCSMGIELVNENDGHHEYPRPQLEVCADLVADICKEHKINANNVIGHADIAPGCKTDPDGFPWIIFRGMLLSRGISGQQNSSDEEIC